MPLLSHQGPKGSNGVLQTVDAKGPHVNIKRSLYIQVRKTLRRVVRKDIWEHEPN